MKKHLITGIAAMFACAMFLSASSVYAGDYDDLPAADVQEQGFDFYKQAEEYNDLKARLGPIPNPGRPLQVGFVCKAFENEFWRLNKDGVEIQAEAMRKAGIDIKMDCRAAQGETDETGQLALLTDMVNKKYDGIQMSPISDGNLLPGVERAMERNIPMVVVNDAFMPQIDTTVGAQHWKAGELAAAWFSERIKEGEVAIISGTPRNPAARSRTDGFRKWFEKNNPKIKVVDTQNGDWDRMKAMNITETMLKAYPNLKGIYSNNDTMAMGAIEAIKGANKVGKVLLLGTDGTGEAYESIRAGELTGTVDNFPFYMSQIGMEMLVRKIAGQKLPKVIYTPQVVVDSSNCNADPKELIQWTGPVFK